MELPQFFFGEHPMKVQGFTALHIATVRGHVASVATLLEEAAPGPNEIASQRTERLEWLGTTALHLAVIHGHLATTHLLMEDHRVDPDLRCTLRLVDDYKIPGLTALHLAARHDRPSIARLLLEHPRFASMNVRTEAGTHPPLSAIAIAAFHGCRAVVESLYYSDRFKLPVDPQEICRIFLTPLERGHRSVSAFFMEHGDISSFNRMFYGGQLGKRALQYALYNGHEGVVRTLLDYPDLLPIANDTTWESIEVPEGHVIHDVTALHLAVLYGHVGVLRCLLKSGQFPADARCIFPLQPPLVWLSWEANVLHLASLHGQSEFVQLLLNSSEFPTEQVNATCVHGATALHVAVQNAHVDVVRCLLLSKRFTHANAVEHSSGYTALHRAAWLGHSPIVKVLLESDSFTAREAKTNKNQTALDMAYNRREVADMLRNM